jgi:hypothetical protein
MATGRRSPADEPIRTAAKEHWAALSVVVAVLSLAAALVFNGLQVRENAKSQTQAKVANEVGLLTQLQNTMRESLYGTTPYRAEFDRLRQEGVAALSPAAYQVMAEESSNMEYFAWLFDNGYLTASGASELWGPRMICEFREVFAPAFKDAADELPDLYQFIVERPDLSRLAGDCG